MICTGAVREQYRRSQLRHGLCRLPGSRWAGRRHATEPAGGVVVSDGLQAVRGAMHRHGGFVLGGLRRRDPRLLRELSSPTPAPTRCVERRAPPARFPLLRNRNLRRYDLRIHPVTPAITPVDRPVPATRRSRRAARLASMRAPPRPMAEPATCDGTTLRRDLSVGDDSALRRSLHRLQRDVCSGVCPSGSHDCSGTCQPNTSPNACGTSCTPCATPTNGATTCDGTAFAGFLTLVAPGITLAAARARRTAAR